MISIKTVYIGNENESYIQDDFAIAGVNIISSDENHVGKTIVMQAIMYALGSEARFPQASKATNMSLLLTSKLMDADFPY